MDKIANFTMSTALIGAVRTKYVGWREAPANADARNRPALYKHMAQVTIKVTFTPSLGAFLATSFKLAFGYPAFRQFS
jgi:hypothetical protein